MVLAHRAVYLPGEPSVEQPYLAPSFVGEWRLGPARAARALRALCWLRAAEKTYTTRVERQIPAVPARIVNPDRWRRVHHVRQLGRHHV